MKRSILLVFLLAGAGMATSLSGTAKLPNGYPLSGVAITLSKTKIAAVATNANGTWTLTTTSGIRNRSDAASPSASNPAQLNGHLTLDFLGAQANGRVLPKTADALGLLPSAPGLASTGFSCFRDGKWRP